MTSKLCSQIPKKAIKVNEDKFLSLRGDEEGVRVMDGAMFKKYMLYKFIDGTMYYILSDTKRVQEVTI